MPVETIAVSKAGGWCVYTKRSGPRRYDNPDRDPSVWCASYGQSQRRRGQADRNSGNRDVAVEVTAIQRQLSHVMDRDYASFTIPHGDQPHCHYRARYSAFHMSFEVTEHEAVPFVDQVSYVRLGFDASCIFETDRNWRHVVGERSRTNPGDLAKSDFYLHHR